ncbi:MAG: tripartite tricarboxylate transporter TctB family protein [Sedimentibacter sp.]
MTKLRWIDWLVFIIVGFIIGFMLFSIMDIVNNKGIALFSTESPLVFPFLIGVAMLVCWILTIILDVKKAGAKHTAEESKELLHDILVALVYVVGVLIYTVVIDIIGFLIGTILFLIIGMVCMNYEESKIVMRIRNAAIVSCITVPLLYYVFHEVFKVMLP